MLTQDCNKVWGQVSRALPGFGTYFAVADGITDEMDRVRAEADLSVGDMVMSAMNKTLSTSVKAAKTAIQKASPSQVLLDQKKGTYKVWTLNEQSIEAIVIMLNNQLRKALQDCGAISLAEKNTERDLDLHVKTEMENLRKTYPLEGTK